jgi:hypothetical protein
MKSLLHRVFRSFGFDVFRLENIEKEIERRVTAKQNDRLREMRDLCKAKSSNPPLTKKGVYWVSRDELFPEAMKLMNQGGVVLDIGCAFRPQLLITPDIHICCEPFGEYMDRLMIETHDKKNFVYVSADLAKASEIFPPSSVDMAFLLDVIEHLDAEPARHALKRLQGIVRKQIVLFTPLGFTLQESESEKDQWGMGGVEWQRHRSGWTPDDFPAEEGWTVIVTDNFHEVDGYGRKFDKPEGALWAIWDRAH